MAQMGWKNKADEDLKQEIAELKNYLNSTDFYYIRQQETGKPVAKEIKDKRIAARQRLNDLGL